MKRFLVLFLTLISVSCFAQPVTPNSVVIADGFRVDARKHIDDKNETLNLTTLNSLQAPNSKLTYVRSEGTFYVYLEASNTWVTLSSLLNIPQITVDANPTVGSSNPVSSNGTALALNGKEPMLNGNGFVFKTGTTTTYRTINDIYSMLGITNQVYKTVNITNTGTSFTDSDLIGASLNMISSQYTGDVMTGYIFNSQTGTVSNIKVNAGEKLLVFYTNPNGGGSSGGGGGSVSLTYGDPVTGGVNKFNKNSINNTAYINGGALPTLTPVSETQGIAVSQLMLVEGQAAITISGITDAADEFKGYFYQFLNKAGDAVTGFGRLTTPNTTLNVPAGSYSFRFNCKWNEPSDNIINGIQIEYGAAATAFVNPVLPVRTVSGNELQAFSLVEGARMGVYKVATEKETDALALKVESRWKGKKGVWDGDSMTAGGEIPTAVANIIGCTFENQAVAGSGYVAPINGSTVYTRANDIASKNPDFIVVLAGTNDWNFGWPLGSFDTRDDTQTFYGAVYQTFYRYVTQNVGIPVLVCTPFQRNAPNALPGKYAVNNQGLQLIDYVNVIKDCAQKFALPVCDFYSNSGITAENVIGFSGDGLHINTTERGVSRAAGLEAQSINLLVP